MGNSCSSCIQVVEASTSPDDHGRRSSGGGIGVVGNEGQGSVMIGGNGTQMMMLQQPCVDPLIYDLVRRTFPQQNYKGQHHLLYHKMKRGASHHQHYSTAAESNVLVGNEHASSQQQQQQHYYHHHDSSDTHHDPTISSPKKTTQTRLILRRRGGAGTTTTTTSSTTTSSTTTTAHQETHIYAIRYPKELLSAEQLRDDDSDGGPGIPSVAVEAAPRGPTQALNTGGGSVGTGGMTARPESKPDDPYSPSNMRPKPSKNVKDWVCVSEELDIYVCDTGLSFDECNGLVATTEMACKGHYAAYTYAKQTLGCREYPTLAQACFDPVHRVTHAILDHCSAKKKKEEEEKSKDNKTMTTTTTKSSTTTTTSDFSHYQLDDREPHIVKYDVTKKERQKLDMHTDKSEWTFLIALSDGCGLDYEGGGTFFEALNATVHVQRGHALIFPGKLRHCGQRITKGLRFLLVGFLVDKKAAANNTSTGTTTSTTTTTTQQAQQTSSQPKQQQQQQQQATSTITSTMATATATSIPSPGAAAKAGTTSDYTTVSYAELNKAKSFRVGGVTPWSDIAASADDLIAREA